MAKDSYNYLNEFCCEKQFEKVHGSCKTVDPLSGDPIPQVWTWHAFWPEGNSLWGWVFTTIGSNKKKGGISVITNWLPEIKQYQYSIITGMGDMK